MEKRILDPNNSFKKMKKGNVKINIIFKLMKVLHNFCCSRKHPYPFPKEGWII